MRLILPQPPAGHTTSSTRILQRNGGTCPHPGLSDCTDSSTSSSPLFLELGLGWKRTAGRTQLPLKGENSPLRNPKLSLCEDLCASRTPLIITTKNSHKTKFQNVSSRELPTGAFWWASLRLLGNWLGETEKSKGQVYQHSDSFLSLLPNFQALSETCASPIM